MGAGICIFTPFSTYRLASSSTVTDFNLHPNTPAFGTPLGLGVIPLEFRQDLYDSLFLAPLHEWHCLGHPKFSRFDTIRACDRLHTNRQTLALTHARRVGKINFYRARGWDGQTDGETDKS